MGRVKNVLASCSKLTFLVKIFFLTTFLFIVVRHLKGSDIFWGHKKLVTTLNLNVISVINSNTGNGSGNSSVKFFNLTQIPVHVNRTLITEVPPGLRKKLVTAGYKIMSKKMSFSTVLEVKSKWPEIPYYDLTIREILTKFPEQFDEFWVGLVTSLGPLIIGPGPDPPEGILYILKNPNVTSEFTHCFLHTLGSKINGFFQVDHKKEIDPLFVHYPKGDLVNFEQNLKNYTGNILIFDKCSFTDCSNDKHEGNQEVLNSFLTKYFIKSKDSKKDGKNDGKVPVPVVPTEFEKKLMKTLLIFVIDIEKDTCRSILPENYNLIESCGQMDKIIKIINESKVGFKIPSDAGEGIEIETFYKKLVTADPVNIVMLKNGPSGHDCSWAGTIGQMAEHILKDHQELISSLRGDDIVFIAEDVNAPNSMNWLVIVMAYESYFLGRLNKIFNPSSRNAEFSISFDLIGTSENARKFNYKLEIRGKDKRRLAWEAPMKSLLERVQESLNDPPAQKYRKETLVFNDKQMNLLKNEDGRLSINIVVEKTLPQDSDDEFEEVKSKSSQSQETPQGPSGSSAGSGHEKKSKGQQYDNNDNITDPDEDVFEEKDFYAYLNKYARK